MKRLAIISLVLLGFTVSSFANEYKSVVYKLNQKNTFSGIVRSIGADYEQQKDLLFILNRSEQKFEYALKKGLNLDEAEENALLFSLGNAKQILSEQQYKKFRTLINITYSQEKMLFIAEK